MVIDFEALILSISLIISIIALLVGLVRGIKASQTLGGGLLTMVMHWTILIVILTAGCAFFFFIELTQDNQDILLFGYILLLIIPICLLRIIWGFADYVISLKNMIGED
jgi:hypothetical protein